MTNISPKLGALRCATITCRSIDTAISAYQSGLGFILVQRGHISPDLAESWGAIACSGAAYAILGPPTGAETFVRFVEDPEVEVLTPYTTLGWAALEFSVGSSDRSVQHLMKAGFDIIGPAQDLAFSEGALRAAQVRGPFGEILYLTQVNAQLEHYVLPTTDVLTDKMFIVILGVASVDESYRLYSEKFGMIPKEPFYAEVPFIAEFQGLNKDHSYYVGCLELEPKSYIEVDEMATMEVRLSSNGRLPPGISIISFEAPSLEPFRNQALTPPRVEVSAPYDQRAAISIKGPSGEIIEILDRSVKNNDVPHEPPI